MKIYRFSPIKNKKQFIETINYVSTQTSKLCNKIIGKKLPIVSLTVFSHYAKEYFKLIEILKTMGVPYNANNGFRFSLNKPIKSGNNLIKYVRIRLPDPYRMQVGCSDFEIENYEDFKKRYLENHPGNLRLIKRPEYEMIEFFDPDFDVFAYIVSVSKKIKNLYKQRNRYYRGVYRFSPS